MSTTEKFLKIEFLNWSVCTNSQLGCVLWEARRRHLPCFLIVYRCTVLWLSTLSITCNGLLLFKQPFFSNSKSLLLRSRILSSCGKFFCACGIFLTIVVLYSRANTTNDFLWKLPALSKRSWSACRASSPGSWFYCN